MNIRRIAKSLAEVREVGVDLLLGRYPGFVYGQQLAEGEIPVFVFHGVERRPFEEMLRFLERNGYSTLTSEDLLRLHADRGGEMPPKPVMITFDDGLKSVHDAAFPLLERYRFRATVFLIPGRIGESEELSGWAEIAAMHQSGVIDFQSHTNRHELIFTSPGIVDFLCPELLDRFHEFEFPRECLARGAETGDLPFGRPLYTTAPRMSDERRFLGEPELVRACIEHVAADGAAFFEGGDWRGELNRVVRRYRVDNPENGRYETEEDRRAAISADLRASKDIMEKKLPGKAVRSLCLPWGVGGTAALEAARSAGFDAVYWGKVDGMLVYRRFADPFRISRIGEDFFPLLPGEGRRSVRQLVMKKIGKRFRRGSPYLSH